MNNKKPILLVILIMLLFLLPKFISLPSLFPSDKLQIVKTYSGDFEDVITKVKEEFGPLEEKLHLEDGAWLKGDLFSVQILKDNYLKGDYVVFVSY